MRFGKISSASQGAKAKRKSKFAATDLGCLPDSTTFALLHQLPTMSTESVQTFGKKKVSNKKQNAALSRK